MPRRFFSDSAPPTFLYTLSLHDALPICRAAPPRERATGAPHLPSRRLHLRVRLLARLLQTPQSTALPLPKADQELSRRLTPADSAREAASFKLMCSLSTGRAQVSSIGEL